MSINSNKGFSLIEVIVSIVLISVLFICITFSFNAILSLDILSNKRDQSVNLTSTILEQLSIVEYSNIDENFKFKFPNDVDISEISYTLNRSSEDNSVNSLYMDNIKCGLNSYNVTIDFEYGTKDSGVGAEINRYKMPKIKNFGGKDSIIICTESEINKFNVNDLGGYTFKDGGYKINDDYISYDMEILNNFYLSHINYCDKLYTKEYNRVVSYNMEHPDSPLPLPSKDDYFTNVTAEKLRKQNIPSDIKLIDRKLVIDILNAGSYQTFNCKLVYTLDLDESVRYIDYLKNSGDISNKIDSFLGDDKDSYEVDIYNNFNIENLNNLVIVHTDSLCSLDNISINNLTSNLQAGDKKFDLFLYDDTIKSESYDGSYIQGEKLETTNETSLYKIEVNQDLAEKVITCHSNNDKDIGLLNGTGRVIIPDNFGAVGDKDNEIRCYKAVVTIKNSSNNKIYHTSSCNILN